MHYSNHLLIIIKIYGHEYKINNYEFLFISWLIAFNLNYSVGFLRALRSIG